MLETNPLTRVVVALSGGVDSSVAAALLVQQGYEVIGMMMRLWSEPGSEKDNRCCTPDAMANARRVAARMAIPFYAIDAQEVFFKEVVQSFFDGYRQGITPNPCLVCNRQIRWRFLLDQARSVGAAFMATGHYAQVKRNQPGSYELLRGVDDQKDQSYVLHMLNQEQLSQAMFPLGQYTKPEVRQLARDFGLPVAERPDSQDLCFLGEEPYTSFLIRHAPDVQQPGPIITRAGTVLGEHQGLAFYTIGQRKGLGIATAKPLYVIDKGMVSNTLIVGTKDELGQDELIAGAVNWIAGQPPDESIRAQVKIRYKAADAWATITPIQDNLVHIQFDYKLRDITPGQAAVFYQGARCLGGGIITDEKKRQQDDYPRAHF